jgi:hypothetical protein
MRYVVSIVIFQVVQQLLFPFSKPICNEWQRISDLHVVPESKDIRFLCRPESFEAGLGRLGNRKCYVEQIAKLRIPV